MSRERMGLPNLSSIRVLAGVCHSQKLAFGVFNHKIFVCDEEVGHEISSAVGRAPERHER